MPELPEVEVTRRGLAPHVAGCLIAGVEIREPRLRWRIGDEVRQLAGRMINAIGRRGKYLLLDCGDGHLILHLGMSGSLRLLPPQTPAGRHDHFDLLLGDRILRLRDPRRFGAVVWTSAALETHPLLAHLGVEPLSRSLDSSRLHRITRAHRTSIKQFLMDSRQVVGVGNIYASESLFRAGISPHTRASRLSIERCARLARAIKETLRAAIRAGGSSLRDFAASDGSRGCFQQRHSVYGRENEPCRRCGTAIRRIIQGQRSTFYCRSCQR
jgi:formamidopyrimidine-DNA glycosylase